MASLGPLPPGKGKILDINGASVCVFNDNGAIKGLSPVCPHLGCDVEWNDSENTWDCPCHGSRFEGNGNLKNGPSRRGLDSINVKIEGDDITLE